MVGCAVIPRLLLQLQLSAEVASTSGFPGDHHRAAHYIWTTLVNLAQRESFLKDLVSPNHMRKRCFHFPFHIPSGLHLIHRLTPVTIAVGAQVNPPGLVEEVCNELQSGEHQLEVGQFVVNVTYHAELRGKLPPSL